jgi:hypothetical protein
LRPFLREIKQFARGYAMALGGPGVLRDIEPAMGRQEASIAKLQTTIADLE